jgi:hypothetical protein
MGDVRPIPMMLLAIRQFSAYASPITTPMTDSPIQLRVRNADSVDATAREIAQRAAMITRSRLHIDAGNLDVDELRGYVRARAVAPVRFQVQQLAAEGRLSADVVEQLIGRALERTVHIVVREMSRPVVAGSHVYMPLPAAA